MGKHTEMPRGCYANPDTLRGIEHSIFVCEGKGAAEVWQLEDGFHVQRRGSTGFPKHFINSCFGEAKARALAYVTACYAAHPDHRTADVLSREIGITNTQYNTFRYQTLNQQSIKRQTFEYSFVVYGEVGAWILAHQTKWCLASGPSIIPHKASEEAIRPQN
eukprot:Lankesteria_metandrocarpae@DN5456_c0_g1_i26.p1